MAAEYLLPLADGEKTALTALLKRTIADDRYPRSPRIGVLRGIWRSCSRRNQRRHRYRRSRRIPRLAARQSSAEREDDQMRSHGLQEMQRRSQG